MPAVAQSKNVHRDGTPKAAESGGERYEGCIECDGCGRIWVWSDVVVVDNRRTACVECVQDEGRQ